VGQDMGSKWELPKSIDKKDTEQAENLQLGVLKMRGIGLGAWIPLRPC
jgi:hypothetical protein